MKSLEHYWNSINPVSILLLPLTAIFCLLAVTRKLLYQNKILSSYKAPVPVVIVGNISVGGTGKTPLIIELVSQLQSKGYKPAVISRGYGGQAESWPQIVNADSDPRQLGDEPCLIVQKTGCPVVVGANRQQDIRMILSEFECDIVLSDDGMQHYALQRDAEIAVIDAQRLFGNGLCLPSGPLRELKTRLKQVDLVLYNGETEQALSYTMQAHSCETIVSGQKQKVTLQDLSGKKVHAIAGIGNPARFFTLLESFGIEVIPHAFSDHHYYNKSELLFDDDYPVLMTEKDAVKCHRFALENWWAVPVTIELTTQAQFEVDQLFDTIFKQGR